MHACCVCVEYFSESSQNIGLSSLNLNCSSVRKEIDTVSLQYPTLFSWEDVMIGLEQFHKLFIIYCNLFLQKAFHSSVKNRVSYCTVQYTAVLSMTTKP